MPARWIAALGVTGATVYVLVAGVALGIVVTEDEGLVGPLAWLVPPAAAAGLFGYGAAGAFGTRYWLSRVVGWTGMLTGSLILISFSFILWPVVLAEIPLLWKWTPERPLARA